MINKRLLLILAAVALLAAAGCRTGTDNGGNTTPDNGGSAEAECSSDSDCATTGCSGQLCAKREKASDMSETQGVSEHAQNAKRSDIITTCEYKEEYGCLRLTSCGCNEGRCGWAENVNYSECIEQISSG